MTPNNTPEALDRAIDAVCAKWNMHRPDARRILECAMAALLAAQPDRAAEYDDAASATPTDAEILSSLRGLYASDAAAAMAAEDDVRTVRAFLARRKNYAFPPAPAVPEDVQPGQFRQESRLYLLDLIYSQHQQKETGDG